MKIVITHLTRMNQGHICVAGLEVETLRHIRPVLRSNLLTPAFLANNGGYFQLGHQLDLGNVQTRGTAPAFEDYLFEPRRVSKPSLLSSNHFWEILRRTAKSNLTEIFSSDLKPLGRSGVIEIGKGTASLGCLKPVEQPHLYIDAYNRLRISLVNQHTKFDLSLTDLRFYESDHSSINRAAFSQASDWLLQGIPVLLSVGLSRAWQKQGDTVARHWLQVNNIHFESNPFWLVPTGQSLKQNVVTGKM